MDYPKVAVHEFNGEWLVLLKKEEPFDENEYFVVSSSKEKEKSLVKAIEVIENSHRFLKTKIEKVIEGFGINDFYISDSFGIPENNINLPEWMNGDGEKECNVTTFSEFHLDEEDGFIPYSGVFMIGNE